MNHAKNNKFPLYIGIFIVLLLIILRFGLFFLKSDGFSGLSVWLPALLFGFIIFALCTSAFFAAWVYEDCKKRGDDPVLWGLVVFIATPFIGLLIYFLRRSEIKDICGACGHKISLKAKYCEECGTPVKKEDNNVMVKQETHHLKYIVAGIVSMTLMLICLIFYDLDKRKHAEIVKQLKASAVNAEEIAQEEGTLHILEKVTDTEEDNLMKELSEEINETDDSATQDTETSADSLEKTDGDSLMEDK